MAAACAPVNPAPNLLGAGLRTSRERAMGGVMAGKNNDREDRLAAALRENLKRRKAQARGASDSPPKDSAD